MAENLYNIILPKSKLFFCACVGFARVPADNVDRDLSDMGKKRRLVEQFGNKIGYWSGKGESGEFIAHTIFGVQILKFIYKSVGTLSLSLSATAGPQHMSNIQRDSSDCLIIDNCTSCYNTVFSLFPSHSCLLLGFILNNIFHF